MANFKKYRKREEEYLAASYEEGMEDGFVTRYRSADANEDGSVSTWGISDDVHNIEVRIPYFYNLHNTKVLAGEGWTVVKNSEGRFVGALPTHRFDEIYAEV